VFKAREKLYKRVDTCVAETKKFNAVAPEISQSQLFTAIGSAIFNVFGNANLGSVSSAEKNTLEFLWWHALCMFGILCHKHGYEWKGDADVQSFEPLRKKNGIKSGSNINESLWKETPLRQHLGVPKPAEAEFEQYILQYHQDFSLAKISEARKCVTCGTTTSSQWLKSETGASKCGSCYRRERAASANNTCVTCIETTSSKWYNLKTDPPTSKCKKCYMQEYNADKKRKREHPG
jgi:hypothetical protein